MLAWQLIYRESHPCTAEYNFMLYRAREPVHVIGQWAWEVHRQEKFTSTRNSWAWEIHEHEHFRGEIHKHASMESSQAWRLHEHESTEVWKFVVTHTLFFWWRNVASPTLVPHTQALLHCGAWVPCWSGHGGICLAWQSQLQAQPGYNFWSQLASLSCFSLACSSYRDL